MSNEQKQPQEGKPLTAEEMFLRLAHDAPDKGGMKFISLKNAVFVIEEYTAQQTASLLGELENAKGAMDAYYEIADLLRVPEGGSVIEAVEGLKTTLDETYAGALADNEELEKVKEELERWKSKYEFSVEAGKVISDELEKWKDSTKDLADQKGKLLKELEAVKKERDSLKGTTTKSWVALNFERHEHKKIRDQLSEVTRQRDEANELLREFRSRATQGNIQDLVDFDEKVQLHLSRLSSGETKPVNKCWENDKPKPCTELQIKAGQCACNPNRPENPDCSKPISEWISVEERLPELTEPATWFNDDTGMREIYRENDHATVWAYNPEMGAFKAEFSGKRWVEKSSISIRGDVKPTHWMPLPAPPESLT